MMTASASVASRNVACDSIARPFIDRTRVVGQAIETRQSGFFTRLRMPKAISESSSLKPSKVRIARCTGESAAP